MTLFDVRVLSILGQPRCPDRPSVPAPLRRPPGKTKVDASFSDKKRFFFPVREDGLWRVGQVEPQEVVVEVVADVVEHTGRSNRAARLYHLSHELLSVTLTTAPEER